MTILSKFNSYINILSEWAQRSAHNKYYTYEYLKGVLEGSCRTIKHLISDTSRDELPELILKDINNSDTDLVGYIDVFDYFYPIYLDDPGQCYFTKIDNCEISFGTYNTEIVYELIYHVVEKRFQNMLNLIGDIYNGKL